LGFIAVASYFAFGSGADAWEQISDWVAVPAFFALKLGVVLTALINRLP
jgi:hypothetical protein